MRFWIILAVVLLIACPALAVDINPVLVDPTKPLTGTIILKGESPDWQVTGLKDGLDLDLGFNDYIDVKLKLGKESSGDIKIGYGVSATPGFDSSRQIDIPAKVLLRDGVWHVYRIDVGLEKLWRGTLTDLKVIPDNKSNIELSEVKVGDFGAEDYVPNYTQRPKTEYELHSKHFRFIWNEEKAKAAKPMTAEWAHGTLRNAEECWQLYIKGFGMNEPADKDPQGRRYLINFICTEPGYNAGGDRLNIDPSGLIVDPPSWVIPHEFRHMCQFYSNVGDGQVPQDMYESDANYTRECWLWFYGPTLAPDGPKTTVEFSRLLNYCVPHGRTYYIDWPFMVYLNENPDNLPEIGGQFWWKVWADAKPNEYFWDTIQRLAPEVSRKDLLGYVARRRAYAYKHRLPSDPSERTELKASADMPGWWQVPSEMAPMQGGFTISELVPDKKSGTVTVDFKGVPDKERGNDWRACLVVLSEDGSERYSKLWNDGKESVTLGPKENKVLLVVAGTPDKMIPSSFDDTQSPYRTAPGKSRMQYQVKITGAIPKESKPDLKDGFHIHKNGGGKVANSAQVDETAYVGPNAVVMGSAQVRGNARIEDFACVKDDAKVSDNAVVSGHAVVAQGSVVKDNAKVRDYAEVRKSTISGHARVLEHAVIRDGGDIREWATAKGRAEVWEDNGSYVGGDGVADGDHCGAQTITNGFQYGHQPYIGDPWVDQRKAPARVLAEYDFDKANESLALDGYGSADAYLRGNPKWASQDGARTGILSLTGKDYVVLDRYLVDEPEFTFSAWLKWDGGKANQALFSFGANNNQCMWLTPDDGKGHAKLTAKLNGKEESVIASSALPKGEWVHVAVTGQGIYLNGKLISKGSISIRPDQVLPANVNTAPQQVYLGGGLSGQPGFVGSFDSVAFFSKTMSESEVAALMTAAPASANCTNQPPAPKQRRQRRPKQ